MIPHTTPGAEVQNIGAGNWRLSIPPGIQGNYRLAQHDDYPHLPRRDFLWIPPLHMSLSARVSETLLPGTWGFGFWNDPFNISLGLGGTARRLPSLPNAAWFFHASEQNYLSLRNEQPAHGMLMATFSSPRIPSLFLSPGIPFLPFLSVPFTSKYLRRMASLMIHEDAAELDIDPTVWHHYQIEWHLEKVSFYLDDQVQFETETSPKGKL
ncbi:MAG: family 16 glycosylhydrolase, partial [Anaerolineaceae bacterium]|nr:family 16 glycosylhydrolase [Anaerolineaceae bacterium]